MGIREGHAHPREAIDIRRFRLRIPSEMSHPMIQIVHGDKQHIGLLRRLGGPAREHGKHHQQRNQQSHTDDTAFSEGHRSS
jgi:hypothetical protein